MEDIFILLERCWKENGGSAYDDLQQMPDGGTTFGEQIECL